MEFACSHVVCNWLKANVNVVSLGVGKLVDISQSGMETFQKPVICGKCSSALSCLSSLQKNVWQCEFCGGENSVDESLATLCIGQRAGVRSDDLYLPRQSEDDYQNLEDTLVIFCVDISGSMSVTTEQGMQDALYRALSSIKQQSPHRRVALVTFNDEVVIYGDGTSTPLTLRDWALVDYDHIWQKGVNYHIPHCIAETYHHLIQRVKLREHGATCLGPAALASVAMASRYPGSKVNIVSTGTVAREIQSVSEDNVLATGVKATLLASDGYFPYEDENNHKLVKEIGNVTKGLEITFQFAVKPDFMEMLPFQLQLSFKTRDQHRITRIITEQRPVTTCRISASRLNMAVLGVHCAQLCASLTMEGQVQEAQRQLKAQQDLLQQVSVCSLIMLVVTHFLFPYCSKWRPIQKEESIYGNWMETMTTICEDITTESQFQQALSDEAAKVVYQMKRASSVR
uniref:VWFA domain-containing protein n=1 Tax=Amphilophus citrinellus TaxID=61819 RepID=A0A3Q0R3U8_AMPCI